MKLYKLSALALVAVALTACADEEESFTGGVNTNPGVTVSAQTSFTYNGGIDDLKGHTSDTLYVDESAQFFNVPVLVNGETNGKIVCTVEVVAGTPKPEMDLIPADETTHYVVTSKVFNIPEGAAVGGCEISLNWAAGVVDENKTFTVNLIAAQGAKIVGKASTVVTILNVDNPYTKMCGAWKCTAFNIYDNADAEFPVTISTPASDSPQYGSVLRAVNFMNDKDAYLPMTFSYDNDTQVITMAIPQLAQMSGIWNFGTFYAVPFTYTSTGAALPCTADFNKIEVVDQDASVICLLIEFTEAAGLTNNIVGEYDGYSHIKFTR